MRNLPEEVLNLLDTNSENKNKIINSLNKNNYTHKEDFFSNYNTSYLSIASLLQSSYPATEDSKKYYNRPLWQPHLRL